MNALTQEGFEMKPGYCLNPFDPLFSCEEPEGDTAMDLYYFAHNLDAEGAKGDFQHNLEHWSREIRRNSMSWFKTALIAWKVKLMRAREPLYSSHREWCEVALGKSAATINNYIRAARAVSILIAAGFTSLPQLCAVALELSKLSEDRMIETWREVCDRYPEHQINLEKIRMTLGDPMGEKPKTKGARLSMDRADFIQAKAAEAGISFSLMLDRMIDSFMVEGEKPEEKEHPIDVPDVFSAPLSPELDNSFTDDLADEDDPGDYIDVEPPKIDPDYEPPYIKREEPDDPDPDDWDTDYPFPAPRIKREDCDDLTEAWHESRGEFDDEPIDEYALLRSEGDDLDQTNDTQLDEVGEELDIPPDTGEVHPTDGDPLSFAKFAFSLGRIKEYFVSDFFKGWAIVEWSGRVLPLSEWLEVF